MFPPLKLWPSLPSRFPGLKEFLQSLDHLERITMIYFRGASELKVAIHSGFSDHESKGLPSYERRQRHPDAHRLRRVHSSHAVAHAAGSAQQEWASLPDESLMSIGQHAGLLLGLYFHSSRLLVDSPLVPA
jgi:hypothetical protein